MAVRIQAKARVRAAEREALQRREMREVAAAEAAALRAEQDAEEAARRAESANVALQTARAQTAAAGASTSVEDSIAEQISEGLVAALDQVGGEGSLYCVRDSGPDPPHTHSSYQAYCGLGNY